MNGPEESPTEDQIRGRARLLPEEEAAGGSADPEAMAKEVLESSEERVNAPHDPPDGDDPNNIWNTSSSDCSAMPFNETAECLAALPQLQAPRHEQFPLTG